MERNGGSGKQWDCRHWCGKLRSHEGEIWSCGVHTYIRIRKVIVTGLFTLFTIFLNLLLSQRRVYIRQKFIFLYTILPWHQKKIDAGKGFSISFCLSLITLITNSNLKHKTIYMISNCNTDNGIFTLSYVSALNMPLF